LLNLFLQFPDVAATVIPVLMEFLTDSNELAAEDVLVFVREAIQKFTLLRPLITEKLLEAFPAVKSAKVHRAALWILGEYANTSKDILEIFEIVDKTLGEVPIVEAEQKRLLGEVSTVSGSEDQKENMSNNTNSASKVTSDGTYATQSAFSVAP
jgi:coatomer subunit beta